MQNFFTTITNSYTKYSNVILLIAGAVLLILLFVFRKQLAKTVLNLFSFLLFKKDEEKRGALKKSLQKPFEAFFAVLGLFLALYMNIPSGIVLKSFKIGVILLICWGMVNYLSDNLFLHLHFGENPDDKINTTAIKFISNILKIVIIMFAVVMVISELGYNINGLITGIGVGGLAVSLAAQDAISNLISGFVIVLEKPFVDGEFISAKSIQGTVVEVTMRSTKIKTLDDSLVTIPNKTLTDDAIINISRMNKRLIDIEFGLVYSTPTEMINRCCEEIKKYLKGRKDILPYPLRVEFDKLDNSSLTLNVFCYTDVTEIHEFKGVMSEVNCAIKDIIEQNNCEFAFPSTSIYIEKQ